MDDINTNDSVNIMTLAQYDATSNTLFSLDGIETDNNNVRLVWPDTPDKQQHFYMSAMKINNTSGIVMYRFGNEKPFEIYLLQNKENYINWLIKNGFAIALENANIYWEPVFCYDMKMSGGYKLTNNEWNEYNSYSENSDLMRINDVRMSLEEGLRIAKSRKREHRKRKIRSVLALILCLCGYSSCYSTTTSNLI